MDTYILTSKCTFRIKLRKIHHTEFLHSITLARDKKGIFLFKWNELVNLDRGVVG